MSNEERIELLKAIKRTDRTLRSKKAAFNYLVELGTITKKGNPRKPYKVIHV